VQPRLARYPQGMTARTGHRRDHNADEGTNDGNGDEQLDQRKRF
jgi:hypothetical protein